MWLMWQSAGAIFSSRDSQAYPFARLPFPPLAFQSGSKVRCAIWRQRCVSGPAGKPSGLVVPGWHPTFAPQRQT